MPIINPMPLTSLITLIFLSPAEVKKIENSDFSSAACAAALKNLEIIERENLVERVRDDIGPYMQKRWQELAQHPIVGEARMIGLMGAIELSPDKANRAPFKVKEGTVGFICREFCFENNLVMRHVGDTMIISPPLVISPSYLLIR